MEPAVASMNWTQRHAVESRLQVTNGDSVSVPLGQLGFRALPWRDVLHEGPVPHVPDDELVVLRGEFLATHGGARGTDVVRVLRDRNRAFDDALGAEGVVLWFEHDLYDQLQLLQVLARVDDPAPVDVILVDRFLGSMNLEELDALWPRRRPLTGDQLDLAHRAWAAFRAPEPTTIAALLEEDTSALPHLGAALRRLLEELPAATTGLSRSERQLLEAIRDGARTPVDAFLASSAREEATFEGDWWSFRRLASLQPLVTPLPPLSSGPPFTIAPVELTDAGSAVLAGELDVLEVVSLDRWLGGTHLTRENLWRWDGGAVSR